MLRVCIICTHAKRKTMNAALVAVMNIAAHRAADIGRVPRLFLLTSMWGQPETSSDVSHISSENLIFPERCQAAREPYTNGATL